MTSKEIIHEGWSSQTRLPWADVSRVLPAFQQRPLIVIAGADGSRWDRQATTPTIPFGNRRRQIWMLDQPTSKDCIVLDSPRLTVDRFRLYRFLSYYADNPSARSELGTAQSIDRWKNSLD